MSENYAHPELEWAKDSRLIMITAHRRENLGEPMRHMFKAIRRVMDEHPDVKAIYPIHMNPVVREIANAYLGNDDRIHIIEPLDVLDFHNFLSRSYLILTDSGGIQEEALLLVSLFWSCVIQPSVQKVLQQYFKTSRDRRRNDL